MIGNITHINWSRRS